MDFKSDNFTPKSKYIGSQIISRLWASRLSSYFVREGKTVQLTSWFICLGSAAFSCWISNRFTRLGKSKTIETRGQRYSDTCPYELSECSWSIDTQFLVSFRSTWNQFKLVSALRVNFLFLVHSFSFWYWTFFPTKEPLKRFHWNRSEAVISMIKTTSVFYQDVVSRMTSRQWIQNTRNDSDVNQ